MRESPTPTTGSRRGRQIAAIGAIIIGILYLINPTSGLVELIPDVLPFIGNLDEAAATGLLLFGIRELRGRQPVLASGNDERQ